MTKFHVARMEEGKKMKKESNKELSVLWKRNPKRRKNAERDGRSLHRRLRRGIRRRRRGDNASAAAASFSVSGKMGFEEIKRKESSLRV